ncbi:glycosyltransferase family 4 protein [Vibrio vulnificus]|uniref:glycosyltransferase family 4 protein n=1 Tax=Vibrio vulnificus TaxID=672 RepID=UPI003ED9C28F
MKKVLFIHHSTGIGGASISLINLINGLDKKNYQSHVVLLKESDFCELLDLNGISYSISNCFFYKYLYVPFIHIVPSWFSISNPIKAIYFIFSYLMSSTIFSTRLLKTYEFDILHLNSLTLVDFLHKSARYNSVIHVREPIANGYFGLRKKIFEYKLNSYADKVIAISKDNLDRINLIQDKGEVVYNWTSVIDKPSNFKVKYNVLYIGGGSIFKGFDFLLRTLPIIRSDIKIVCAGYYEEKQIELLSQFSNVEVVGLVNNVSEYMKNTDFLLNLFVEDHFARPIIEAYANGTTVIATPLNGTVEIVENNIDGYIINDFLPETLANAIEYLLDFPGKIEFLRGNAYLKAKNLFSEKNVNKIEKIYASMKLSD